YAKKLFGRRVNIRLFKYPERLLEALKHEKFDILGSSAYVWNNNLSEWACEMAKRYNPDVVTVRGGWDFPLDEKQREAYMHKYRFTDIFCINEGEIAFSNVVERILGAGNALWHKAGPIDGCIFLDRDNDTFIKGNLLSRIEDLGSIPSPYLEGILDEFFDGALVPVIETARGCPFRCNYCNNAHPYYNKMNFFPAEYTIKEIEYIARKVAPTGIKNLLVADTNFGMYPRDKEISFALKKAQEEYNWPLGIIVNTGKNNVDRIIDSVDVLGKALTISMSVQSMNPKTLKAIARDNINLDMYGRISAEMAKRGKSQIAEVIVPLPEETYASYLEGAAKLFNLGAKRIITHTLELNYGTVYKNEEFRAQYGYDGKFRLVPYDFGTYGGMRVFDYEEVAVSTNSLSFDDYLNIRKFALVMELLYSNELFVETFKFLKETGISGFAFIKYVFDGLASAPSIVREVFDSFAADTKGELKDTEEDLVRFYSQDANYEKLRAGLIGGNVLFKHKGLMFAGHIADWIDYVFNRLVDILGREGRSKTAREDAIDDIKAFVLSKLDGIFLPDRTAHDVVRAFDFDILSWLADNKLSTLNNFRVKDRDVTYRFFFDEDQRIEREDLFKRYGSDTYGLAKIMARVPTLERLFRKTEMISR
nr:radical SAM protein [Candidatus Omnitrophota bacterium]